MPLVSCPTCGRQISTEAESCPQCGHPNRATPRAPAGPTCYACSAPATTRCACCGAFSCAQHLTNVEVYHPSEHGVGSSSHELKCERCLARDEALRKSLRPLGAFAALVMFAMMLGLLALGLKVLSGEKKDTT